MFDPGAQGRHDYAVDRLALVIGDLAANGSQGCEANHQVGSRRRQLDVGAVVLLEAVLGSGDGVGPGRQMGEPEGPGGVGIDLIASGGEQKTGRSAQARQ
jgi:hypothetical protein